MNGIRAALFPHSCDLRPVDVQHRAPPFGVTVTLVLYRCRCARAEVTVLAGRWTLAQVNGERGAREDEDHDR